MITRTKHILILTADAGFGHRSAARASAVALQETHGPDCTVEIVNPIEDERVPSILRDSPADYDKMVREMPGLYKVGYEVSDTAASSAMIAGAMTVMLYDTLRDVVRRCQPDAIVTTYEFYQAPLATVYTTSQQHIPLLTVVTDLAPVHRLWFNQVADLCLVGAPAVGDQAIECGLLPDKVQVTGIPVHPNLVRQDRPRAAIQAELGWPHRPDLTTVLAVGSKRVGHLTDVLHALNHSGLPLQLVLVAGGDDELYQQFQSTEWHVPAHVYNFVEDMPTLMQAADCIVCKAGGLNSSGKGEPASNEKIFEHRSLWPNLYFIRTVGPCVAGHTALHSRRPFVCKMWYKIWPLLHTVTLPFKRDDRHHQISRGIFAE